MKPVSGSSSRPSSPVESSSAQSTKPKVEVKPGLVKAMGKQLLEKGLFVGGHHGTAPSQKAGESLMGSSKGGSVFTKTKPSPEDSQKMKTTPSSSPTSSTKPTPPPKPTGLFKSTQPTPMPRTGKAAVGVFTGGSVASGGLSRKPAIKSRSGAKTDGLQRSNSLDGSGSKKETSPLKRSNSVGDISTEKAGKSDKAEKKEGPSNHQVRMQNLKEAFKKFFEAIKRALSAPRLLYLKHKELKEGPQRILKDVQARDSLNAKSPLDAGQVLETDEAKLFLSDINEIFRFDKAIDDHDKKLVKIKEWLSSGSDLNISKAADMAVKSVQDLQEVSDKILKFYKDSDVVPGSEHDLVAARALGMVKARVENLAEIFTPPPTTL